MLAGHHHAEQRDLLRKWVLLGLCSLALSITMVVAVDELGFGGAPWFGWWDANVAIRQPYTVAFVRPRADGAAARSGLHEGDLIDLRRQTLEGRIAVLYQLMAGRSTVLTIQRGDSTRTVSAVGSTVWNNATFWKLQPMVSRTIVDMWFTACAFLIVLRRWWLREARVLSLVLICVVGKQLDPSFIVVPAASISLILLFVSRACTTLASLLLIRLSSQFGRRSALRALIEYAAYAAVIAGFVADLGAVLGLATSWIDPLPNVLSLSPWRGYLDILSCVLIVLVASAAVTGSPQDSRARSAYLLIPLPIAFLASAVLFTAPVFVNSWFANIAIIAIANAAMLLGALTVTYALLTTRSAPRRHLPQTPNPG